MSTPLYFVGIDVGGTNIKGGVVDETSKSHSSVSLETEAYLGQDHGLERMCEAVRQAVAAANLRLDQIAAIGIATPGMMDIPGGMILDPPNLKPWRNVPVRQHIQDTFHLPTAFQNDGNAAALGEFWGGAGKGAHTMVLFTLGTGVGGGIVIDGEVLEGRHSHGAEVGHMKIETTNPRECGCGHRGCLEAYASATAVVKRTQEALANDQGQSALHANLRRQAELSAREVFEAARDGDALADKIVDDTAFYLALGAANLMHIIDPDRIVFGGGMIAAGEPFLERIRRHLPRVALPVPTQHTEIRFAMLGGDAGYIGAAACARHLLQMKR